MITGEAPTMLDAWREAYQFGKHTLIQGHVAARSGDALARFVGDTLAAEKFERVGARPAVARGVTIPKPLPQLPPRKRA